MSDINRQLLSACESGDLDSVKQSLTGGADIACTDGSNYDLSPLMVAYLHNHPTVINWLLDTYSDNNTVINQVNKGGWIPLHFACRFSDNSDAVVRLAMLTGQVNKKDVWGETPIMWAVRNNNLVAVQAMMTVPGVDWQTRNNKGESLKDMAR